LPSRGRANYDFAVLQYYSKLPSEWPETVVTHKREPRRQHIRGAYALHTSSFVTVQSILASDLLRSLSDTFQYTVNEMNTLVTLPRIEFVKHDVDSQV
jgi:hypothetical protein